MKQERSLNTNTVRGSAPDGKRFVDATSPNADDHALYNLYTFTVTLNDANVDLHRIARRELRGFFFKILNGLD
jgi:hypothetical protein